MDLLVDIAKSCGRLRPSFSAHVRRCERGAPVLFLWGCGLADDVNLKLLAFVELNCVGEIHRGLVLALLHSCGYFLAGRRCGCLGAWRGQRAGPARQSAGQSLNCEADATALRALERICSPTRARRPETMEVFVRQLRQRHHMGTIPFIVESAERHNA